MSRATHRTSLRLRTALVALPILLAALWLVSIGCKVVAFDLASRDADSPDAMGHWRDEPGLRHLARRAFRAIEREERPFSLDAPTNAIAMVEVSPVDGWGWIDVARSAWISTASPNTSAAALDMAYLVAPFALAILSSIPLVPPALRPVLLAGMVNLPVAALNVEWVLRGLERFGSFARGSIIGRLAAVPLVYLLVRGSDDAALAVLVTALGGAFSALIYGYELRRLGMLGRPLLDPRQSWAALKDGAPLSLSTAITSLYTTMLTVVLGIVAGPAQVGLYTGAGRIRAPVHGLLSPVATVFFPRMSDVSRDDPRGALELGRRLMFVQGGLALLLPIALGFAAPLLVHLLLGEAFAGAVPVLRVLAGTIFLIGVSNVAGIMIMIPFDMKREFTACVMFGAVVGLAAIWPLTAAAGSLGAAVAALLSESAVTTAMLVMLARRFGWLRPPAIRAEATPRVGEGSR